MKETDDVSFRLPEWLVRMLEKMPVNQELIRLATDSKVREQLAEIISQKETNRDTHEIGEDRPDIS
jgi:hypothetical protein